MFLLYLPFFIFPYLWRRTLRLHAPKEGLPDGPEPERTLMTKAEERGGVNAKEPRVSVNPGLATFATAAILCKPPHRYLATDSADYSCSRMADKYQKNGLKGVLPINVVIIVSSSKSKILARIFTTLTKTLFNPRGSVLRQGEHCISYPDPHLSFPL